MLRKGSALQTGVDPAPGSMVGSLWRRKGLIALCIVIAIVIAAFYYAQRPPLYRSTAQVLVVKHGGDSAPATDSSAWEEALAPVHMAILRSPLVIGKSVQQGDLQSLPSLQDKADPIQQILQSLTVAAVGQRQPLASSTVLQLDYTASDPQDARRVLEAIIASYQATLDETYDSNSSDNLQQLTAKAEELLQTLNEKEDEYSRFRESAPLVLGEDQPDASAGEERVAALEAQLAQLRTERSEVEARVEAVFRAARAADRQTLQSILAEATGSGPSPGSGKGNPELLAEKLLPLETELRQLRHQFGSDHPKVQSVREQIDVARQLYGTPEQDAPAVTQESVASYYRQLERRVQELKKAELSLEERLKSQQQSAKELTAYRSQDEQHRREIARIEQLYESLITQLQDANLDRDTGGYTTNVIAPPSNGQRVSFGLAQILFTALGGGLLAGIVLAAAVERTAEGRRKGDG